jgi:hypothetical protein
MWQCPDHPDITQQSRKGKVMKTLSVVLLLLASVAFVLVGCSDNSTVPVTPTDQAVQGSGPLSKKTVVNFTMYDFPLAPPTGGRVWETPGGITHLKDREIHEAVIVKYEDGTVELGNMTHFISQTLDANGEGPTQGSFTCTLESGGVWKGTYEGYRSYAPPAPLFPTDPLWLSFPFPPIPSAAFVFEAPLKVVAHGTGGNIDGMKMSATDVIRTFGTPPTYFYGITTGSYK